MSRSIVVTGGGRGVGRSIVERLVQDPSSHVVIVELDENPTGWVAEHPAANRIGVVTGDASDVSVSQEAADVAEEFGTLVGWVNNAALFRDASLHEDEPSHVLELINANLAPAIAGTTEAVHRFLTAGTPGGIVNVSSHQATRPVRGALPYATAKAAVEGFTRAAAVDYGAYGIRVNAVSLGSIVTERLDQFLAGQPDGGDAVWEDLARLHPLGRPGEAAEVADVVAFLLSAESAFITGAVVPVDGGRSALGLDPEAI